MITVGPVFFRSLRAFDGVASARNALRDPVVVVLSQQMQIGGQHLLGPLGHFARRHPRIDPHVAERLIQPRDVLPQLEDVMPEGARHIEHGVAQLEGRGRENGTRTSCSGRISPLK